MMSEQLSPHYKGVYSEEVVKSRSFPVEYVLSERVMQVAPPAPIPSDTGRVVSGLRRRPRRALVRYRRLVDDVPNGPEQAV